MAPSLKCPNGNCGKQSTPRIRIRTCSRCGINSSQFATASRSTHWPKRTRCSQVSNRLPIEHWTLPPETTNFLPNGLGDDRFREQLASLPSCTETNEHRSGHFYFCAHLLWRYRALANSDDAKNEIAKQQQLDFRARPLCLRRCIFVCLRQSLSRYRSPVSVWRGPGHNDSLGVSQRRTTARNSDRWSDRGRRRTSRTRLSRTFRSSINRLDPDGERRRGLGRLFVARKSRARCHCLHRWKFSARGSIRGAGQCHHAAENASRF